MNPHQSDEIDEQAEQAMMTAIHVAGRVGEQHAHRTTATANADTARALADAQQAMREHRRAGEDRGEALRDREAATEHALIADDPNLSPRERADAMEDAHAHNTDADLHWDSAERRDTHAAQIDAGEETRRNWHVADQSQGSPPTGTAPRAKRFGRRGRGRANAGAARQKMLTRGHRTRSIGR